MNLFCDNNSTISIAHNSIQHDHTKHVKIDRHFVNELHRDGIISIPYVWLEDVISEMLTKGLPTQRFWALTKSLEWETFIHWLEGKSKRFLGELNTPWLLGFKMRSSWIEIEILFYFSFMYAFQFSWTFNS